VAQILVAERVPKADKLLRLEVDLVTKKRQILAGIAQYYEPEKAHRPQDRDCGQSLPRARCAGLESNGMLLAASLEGGAPVLDRIPGRGSAGSAPEIISPKCAGVPPLGSASVPDPLLSMGHRRLDRDLTGRANWSATTEASGSGAAPEA